MNPDVAGPDVAGPDVAHLDIASLAQRPERAELLEPLSGHWPVFMTQDTTGDLYYPYVHERHPEHVLVALDGRGEAVAKAYTVPLRHDLADGLPDGGWDWAIRQALHDRLGGMTPTIVSALEIMIRPDVRGGGLSARMLAAMRANVASLGFADLVAPVRPSAKHTCPEQPIDEYARAVRPDGLPVDAWLRVHVRAGGRIVSVAHHSMTVTGTLADWREWTGLPFDTTGPVLVPHALSPVHCDVAQNHAVYIEPNVWIHHAC